MTTQGAALGVANAGFAWAKVNLTLHVTGQRSDGYHLLDSLVVRAGVGDRIAVSPSDQLELFVDGPYGGAAPMMIATSWCVRQGCWTRARAGGRGCI
ncbi:hypothetical protein Sulfitobl28_27350 [Sulfitobacter pontiacus]|nr:hypothetical protein Sulfitobl28_27350 [Sulfitobacter pontiacus]